jgi:hypothetical protein
MRLLQGSGRWSNHWKEKIKKGGKVLELRLMICSMEKNKK